MKSALRQDERLLSYGEPQGEGELREELSRYLRRHRNVVCTPEQIVVGAGVQSLLHILCPMIRERRQVLMNNESFHQGRTVFEDYGFWCGGWKAAGRSCRQTVFFISLHPRLPAGERSWESESGRS